MYQDVNWAMKQEAPATCKHVLLVLAQRANKHHKCFPSLTSITSDTGLNRVTVSRCVAQLLAMGLILRDRRGIQSNVYTLQVVAQRNHQQVRTATSSGELLVALSTSGSCAAQPAVVAQRSMEYPIELPRRGRGGGKGLPTPAPETFEVTPKLREWAVENHIIADLDFETAKMLDHYRGVGKLRVDWTATWKNWMRLTLEFNHNRNGNGNGNGNGSTPGRKYTQAEREAERAQMRREGIIR